MYWGRELSTPPLSMTVSGGEYSSSVSIAQAAIVTAEGLLHTSLQNQAVNRQCICLVTLQMYKTTVLFKSC